MKANTYRTGTLAFALFLGCSAVTMGFQNKVGDPPPAFSVTSMSGKQLFFKDMQTGEPIFIYFIRDGDSVSQQTTSFVNQIIRAYGPSRSTFYGVLNAREDRARSFQAEANPAFRLERDELLTAVKTCGVTSSPTILEFNGKGVLTHTWKGFSAMNLKALNIAVAKASRKPVQDLDFSKAPDTAMYGVDFSSVTGSRG